MVKNSVMSPIVGQRDRQETLASFLVTTRCGLRVGVEVEVGRRRILRCHRLLARETDKRHLRRFGWQQGVDCVLEWRLRLCGEEFGDVAGCWPERPARDTCVVFGDNKVWATCWNGG